MYDRKMYVTYCGMCITFIFTTIISVAMITLIDAFAFYCGDPPICRCYGFDDIGVKPNIIVCENKQFLTLPGFHKLTILQTDRLLVKNNRLVQLTDIAESWKSLKILDIRKNEIPCEEIKNFMKVRPTVKVLSSCHISSTRPKEPSSIPTTVNTRPRPKPETITSVIETFRTEIHSTSTKKPNFPYIPVDDSDEDEYYDEDYDFETTTDMHSSESTQFSFSASTTVQSTRVTTSESQSTNTFELTTHKTEQTNTTIIIDKNIFILLIVGNNIVTVFVSICCCCIFRNRKKLTCKKIKRRKFKPEHYELSSFGDDDTSQTSYDLFDVTSMDTVTTSTSSSVNTVRNRSKDRSQKKAY